MRRKRGREGGGRKTHESQSKYSWTKIIHGVVDHFEIEEKSLLPSSHPSFISTICVSQGSGQRKRGGVSASFLSNIQVPSFHVIIIRYGIHLSLSFFVSPSQVKYSYRVKMKGRKRSHRKCWPFLFSLSLVVSYLFGHPFSPFSRIQKCPFPTFLGLICTVSSFC